ncbi:MAG: glycosyltransferase family 39 protein [Proteobacteria bacterium]|nr:glycosyltransferase family 39 protein [Pseudomonadota bacterium]
MTDTTAADRRAFWLFMTFALAFLALGIGLRDPWPADEPRFALVAKQMVASGDWLFPHRGSELYADKPPLFMWLQALGFEALRSWRVAFLLPSLLSGVLTLALTFDLGRRLWNPRAGLFAAGALLCVLQFAYQVKRAQIDPLVMAEITLANWALLRHCLRGPDWKMYWFGCFMAGIGVITKGVGFLALLMLIPYALLRWRGWEVTRTSESTWRWLLGIPAFLAAIALWLVPMLLAVRARGTPEYIAYARDILLHQTAERYAEHWSHPKPFWYFVPVLLLGWFPISLAYPGAFVRWCGAWRARDARIVLPLGWAALVLAFFSIASGKRDMYVLPMLPMVAVAMGPYLEGIVHARWLRYSAFGIALLLGVAMLGYGAWALQGHAAAARMASERGLTDGGHAVWMMLACVGAAFVLASMAFRPRRGLHALLSGLAAMWVAWSLWAYPLLNDSSSAAGIMRDAGRIIGPQAQLGLVGWREQNMLMAGRPATDFGFKASVAQQFGRASRWQEGDPARRWVFAIDDAIGACVDRTKARRVGVANRRAWWVYRHDAVIPGCVPATPDAASDEAGM